MALKKTTTRKATPKKDALKKLTVPALRAKAKRAGIKLSKTDGSQKTKSQLVLALDKVPTPRKTTTRRKPATGQTGTSNKRFDKLKQALPPGKRRSKTGRVYYERRANRSDQGQLLGAGGRSYRIIQDLADTIYSSYNFENLRELENDFSDAFAETIDSEVTYYSDAMKIVSDTGYYDWSDNDLAITPTNISQVAYLALNELYGDVYEAVKDLMKNS